uniref:EF-hand domain-containing protein n=1 Tax=Macrostomum lignano TaxID=282301 RepID=A0A1I8FXM1_9PLAT
MSELLLSFLAFCNSQKKGSEKASDKVLKKLFMDAGVFDMLSLTSCDMDIAVAAFKGREKLKGDLTFDQFCSFLGQFCKEAERRRKVESASATEALLRVRIAASRPVAHGVTVRIGSSSLQWLILIYST